MKTISERLDAFERLMPDHEGIHGTTLSRTLTQHEGLKWTLSLGAMFERKKFYDGFTIEECLTKAEEDVEFWGYVKEIHHYPS